MSINPLNEISKVYLEQVANIDEALDPVGQEDADVNNNDIDNDPSDKYIMKRRKAIGKAIAKRKRVSEELTGNQYKIDVNNNNQIDSQDLEMLRAMKKKKKKSVKEGYSNWREDLKEIVDVVTKEQNPDQIKEKKVNNKIKINPTLSLNTGMVGSFKESVETLGGTLLEMVEIDEFDSILDDLSESEIFLLSDDLIEEVVEEFFYECLEEGYDLGDVENVLVESIELSTALLNEAKVTLGHDTKIKSDRLEKIKSAVKKVGKGIARGAGYVAGAAVRGAKAIGREFRSGYERGRGGSSGASTSSSGSSTSDSSSSIEQSGGSQSSGSSRPGLLGRIGSALKRGLKRIVAKGARAVSRRARNVARRMEGGSSAPAKPEDKPKTQGVRPDDPWKGSATVPPKAKTTTVSAKPLTREQKQAVVRAQRRNPNLSKSDADRIASATPSKADKAAELRARMAAAGAKRGLDEDNIPELRSRTITDSPSSSGKTGKSRTSRVVQMMRQMNADVEEPKKKKKTVSEETLTDAQTRKKEEVFKSITLSKLKKQYPGKSKKELESLRYAISTKVAQKVAENFIDEAKLPRSMKKRKKTKESKTVVIHDVDDNLADQRHPNAAKIDLMQRNREEKKGDYKKVGELTPSQFAHHELTKDQKFGFDQFKSTDKFKKTTTPNKPVVRLGDSPRRPAQKEVITARSRMDDPRGFSQDLSTRIGVKNLKHQNVRYTGGMRQGSGPEKKGAVVKNIVKPDTKKVITADDHLQNVRHMAAAAAEAAPKAKVRAYQARPARKAKGKVKPGDIVPVRVGKEKDLSDPNIGIRDPKTVEPPKTPKQKQRARKRARRGMGEAVDMNTNQQQPQQQPTSNPQQASQDAKAKSAAQKAKQTAIAIKARELAALRATPAGTSVPGFGG